MITKTNRALSDVFDVEPIEEKFPATDDTFDVVEVPPTEENKDQVAMDNDFEIARVTMHNLLLKGQSTLENAIIVANGTEDPDSFNAVSKMVDTLVKVSGKLMDIHETKQKLKNPAPKGADGAVTAPIAPSSTNINGPVFVGSTSELAAFLNKNKHLPSGE